MCISAADGSLIIDTRLDNTQAHKDLEKLKRDIAKTEQEIPVLQKKRQDAEETSFLKSRELDAEKAKLDQMKASLRELREISKDTSFTPIARADAQTQIPALQLACKEQQERVRMLQTEYNKLENSVDRYGQKIADAAEKLEMQKTAAGNLVKQINDGERWLQRTVASAVVADQRIVDLNRELLDLKQRQKELSSQGIGIGYQEYDGITHRIAEINHELKAYQKQVQAVRSKEICDAGIEQMAADAQAANDRITELQEHVSELENQRTKLGLAFGARKEYDELTAEIEAVNNEIISCEEYLDQLAENGSLAKLANGAEIAEQRIQDLRDYIADLEEQDRKLGLAIGAKDQREQLTQDIAEAQRLMDAYQRNLDGVVQSEQDAAVADQHIVDLNRELLDLKQRQKELEQDGMGLGYEEYDQNAARIAEITQELKEYKKALEDAAKAEQNLVVWTMSAEKLTGHHLKRRTVSTPTWRSPARFTKSSMRCWAKQRSCLVRCRIWRH